MPGRRGDRLGWLRGEIAENVHDSSPVPLGAFTRFTLVTRAFGPGSEAGLGLSVEAGGGSRTAPHGSWPFEVERKALRLGPASPHSVPAESGHSSPLGARPDPRSWPPCKTPGQRRISMSAPFRIRERSPTSSRTGDREGRVRAPSTWRRHPKRSYDPPNMRHEVMSSRATRVAVPVGDLRCLACPGSRRCPREENRR